MLYHVRVSTDEGRRRLDHTDEAFAFHLNEERLRERFVQPWISRREIVCGGLTFAPEHTRLEIMQTPNASSQPFRGRGDWSREIASTETRDVTDTFLTHRVFEGASPVADTEKANNPKAVMVVYGQDHEVNQALFGWLRAIGLEPREWGDLTRASGSASPFIGEILDKAFEDAQAIVVLFTPDEHVKLRGELSAAESAWRVQARPNVLFEAGMAFATHPRRTVLVVLGDQDMPSDLAGRHYVRLDGRPESLNELANRLEAAGCDVRRTGAEWMNADRFPRRDGITTRAPAPARPVGGTSDGSPFVGAAEIQQELNAHVEVAASGLLDTDQEVTKVAVADWAGTTEITIRSRCGQSYAARFRAAGRGLPPADELRTKIAFIHDDLAAKTRGGWFTAGPSG